MSTGRPDFERPLASCGCGFDLVWINGAWEHDAAPSLWGGDHDPDAPAPETQARKEWDHFDLGLPLKGITVPPFEMDVTGEYTGNAYPEQHEYRINMIQGADGETYVLGIENSSGGEVGEVILTDADADGIMKVATTDHSLSVYEDDWRIPSGIERTVQWDLTFGSDEIRLSSGHIDEIADWLEYATGQAEWTGGDTWEER